MTAATVARLKASRTSRPKDAIALLRADHRHVSELFSDYGKARSTSRKKNLVAEICMELTIHARVEEEIFYPAAKEVLKETKLVPEAIVEHSSMKDLIAQIEGGEQDDEMFDAKVTVLSEYVKHHVREEQNELFPKVRDTRLDLVELGARIADRKAELVSERSGRT